MAEPFPTGALPELRGIVPGTEGQDPFAETRANMGRIGDILRGAGRAAEWGINPAVAASRAAGAASRAAGEMVGGAGGLGALGIRIGVGILGIVLIGLGVTLISVIRLPSVDISERGVDFRGGNLP